ncbi:MAG: enoyl-CoA hydratase/isomerase family protein, partial [Candidatus Tectomicrobia bacterium]|nr:enoyl-CoA hydratase/isomerase family protein [Candidatus Tectomicrobia bacterium]
FFGHAYRAIMGIRQIPKPVIAAVNGYAMGGGNELVVAADLAIASEHAKFGQTGPRIARSPSLGGPNTLRLSIGEKKTREVVYLCHAHDAYEAERRGWINKVVPHAELYPEVDRWCQEILDKSPQYIEISKISCNALSDMLYPAFHHAMEMINLMAGSEQMIEGATAFLEKRKPDFRQFRPKTE